MDIRLLLVLTLRVVIWMKNTRKSVEIHPGAAARTEYPQHKDQITMDVQTSCKEEVNQ